MSIIRLTATAVLSTIALAPARAQDAPAAAPAAPAQAAPTQAAPPVPKADTVIARVNGEEIKLGEISEMAAGLPAEYKQMPQQMLFPMLVDQAIDRRALVALAHKQGLEKDPQVAKQIARAEEQALQNALISRDVGPTIAEPAIKARYDQEIGSKPGEDEVHARHILVPEEAEAKAVIDELKKGGDFAALAKAHSKDPGAAQGGDLGFFKKGDMLPEFADVAFALAPGQLSETPVHTRYGWHVIKVEERRTAPAPTYEQSHDELRQKMIQEGVQKVIKEARNGLIIERFNPDGTPAKPPGAEVAPAQ